MNYVISPGPEFADGAEFRDMTQILRNLGSCPPRLEFGAIREFSSRENDAIYE
jgi:hypothetical protein